MTKLQNTTTVGGSKPAGNNAESCCPASKWAVVVNDKGIPAPQRNVKVSVLKSQAGVPAGHMLYRDCSPRSDVPLDDDDVIDLAVGNVFYSIANCTTSSQAPCTGNPKLAWFVDDHHEITLRADQTAESLRELFQLTKGSCLLRDYESPIDEPVSPNGKIWFKDGPVLISRCNNPTGSLPVTIIVEGTGHEWHKRKITHEEVVKLEVPEYPQNPPFTYAVKYKCGPSNKPEGILAPGASVKVKEGMVFNVSETGQS